jgi:spermidine/putrescine transport system permease protein
VGALRARRSLVPWALLVPGLGWLLVFFVIPLYYMAKVSLQEGTLETGYRFTWAFGNYTSALSDFSEQFVRSFVFGGAATLAALVIAYPLAYAIAVHGGKWRNALLLAVIAPFFITYLIRTLSWQTILDDASPTVELMRTLGLIADDGRLLATDGSVIAGITYNFLPFMILPLYASLERIDRRMLEAACDLYATRREVFLRVTLPLSMPGVVAGTLLTFIPSVGDFINAELLGTPNQAMIGNVIQSRYLVVTDYPTAAALSFILMAIILALVAVWARLAGTEALMGAEAR